MFLTPAQIKPKSFEPRQNSLLFFNPGWMRLMFTESDDRSVIQVHS